MFCQVEISATSWSLVQRSSTDCGASLCVIKKPRTRGGNSPLEGSKNTNPQWLVTPGEKKTNSMYRDPYWEDKNSLAGEEISRILWKQMFITAFTSTRHLSLSWASSIQLAIPLILYNFSNQTIQRQSTLIKHPVVNLLKISSLTPVHYMQSDGWKDRYVAAFLPIVIANSPKSNHSQKYNFDFACFYSFRPQYITTRQR